MPTQQQIEAQARLDANKAKLAQQQAGQDVARANIGNAYVWTGTGENFVYDKTKAPGYVAPQQAAATRLTNNGIDPTKLGTWVGENYQPYQAPATMPVPNQPAWGTIPATPWSASSILGEWYGEDPFITQYNQDQLNAYNQTIDPQAAYDEQVKQRQAQIDATNAMYRDQLNQARIRGQGRIGSGTAMQARGGLLGSDFWAAQTNAIQDTNTQVENSIEQERLVAVNQILSQAQQDATAEIAAKRLAKEAGGKAYLEYLSGASERKAGKTTKAAQLLLSLGKSPQDISDEELKQAGISRQDLTMEYTAGKSAQEQAQASAQAEQEKAALEALKTQSEINKNQAAIITEALKTGRVYESGGFIFDGATNQVIGNAQAVQRASKWVSSGGGGGSYAGWYSGGGSAPAPYSAQADSQLSQIGNSTEWGLFMDARTGKTITGNQAQQLYGSAPAQSTNKGSKYTPDQLSVMSVITGKPTAWDKATLKRYGLSEADLGNYRTWNIAEKSNYDKLDNPTKSRIDKYALDFENEQVVKDYNTMSVNINTARTLADSGTDDQALIYTFAKVMDPNSVVRESEYDTVQRFSQSLAQWAYGKIDRVFGNDGFLTEEAKKAIKKTLEKKLAATKISYDNVRDQTKKTDTDKSSWLKGRRSRWPFETVHSHRN